MDRAPFGRPLARAGAGRIPVFLLTGFLGAGKTSLIRELLATPAGANSALIVNEFGAVGIDDALLRAGSEETVLLGNGCLCCTSQTDLQLTMSRLFIERASGLVPNFERVLIETSGLADPTPLLQSLSSDRTIAAHFALAGLVCVIDCATALATADSSPEWSKQAALADRIVLTKSDLVDKAELDAVTALVRSFNPFAQIARAERGRIDPAFILTPLAADLRSSAQLCEPVSAEFSEHSKAYQSFVITRDEPISWAGFSRAMQTLTELRGPDLLRVKGFVHVVGSPGPIVVHFVQHLAHPPEELLSWPDDDHRTRLVFITRGVDQGRIAALLEAVFAIET